MDHLPSKRPPRPQCSQEQNELNISANKASWRAKYLDAAITGIGNQLLRAEANSHAERIVAEHLMDELFSQRLTAREEEQEFRKKWREFQAEHDSPPKSVS